MSSFPEKPEGGTTPWVEALDLVVSYGRKGDKAADGLRGFSASFHPGITGLVGPNGAGKTTFLRAASGLIRPSSGTLSIRGSEPGAFVSQRGIGFLPENPVFPGYLTVEEFLGGILPLEMWDKARDEGHGGVAGLAPILDKPLDSLSLGQRKKVALATAILGCPDVLLLDEPTNGLDPMAVRELRDTLRGEKERGITLIISSHHLDELQRVADTLVFVREGRVAGSWTRTRALDEFGSLEALFDHVFGEA